MFEDPRGDNNRSPKSQFQNICILESERTHYRWTLKTRSKEQISE